ncbi:MAG: hypothetical protein SOH99_07790 [Acidipropionibacterium acidipropionici]|uniref:hypothetical protein n=1 Tax=Acidipropionibacterium acidipropionici TaxID=1748 RepID=UPI0002DEE713|nr:hypothetical protein [Acidipropionibacterium acidipropionici]ALN16266.1 hypothetical protein ASQ49_14460 [Acidipropionibacterium acidipropionici]APZ07986.1 hypothetical protein BWX38_00415 [Acidipropionibacterium acidipropionici]MDN6555955.1 hypothetical protein [Acidipropionibacterium acidipropionici]QCV95300.1 hypothetical protein FEZ30_08515 [Acidipropionibacterium acidipropionici]
MTVSTNETTKTPAGHDAGFPRAALPALAAAGFVAIFTETIPAGQFVTLDSFGSVLAAMPPVCS